MTEKLPLPSLALSGHLSRGEAKAPLQVVALKDPHDITPLRDAFRKRVEDIKRDAPDAKIIVWAGESHTNPVTKLFQPALMNVLGEMNVSAAHSFEANRNIGIHYARDFDFAIPSDWADEFRNRDDRGKIHNSLMAVRHLQQMAPHTIEAIHRFNALNSIETYFTDAARIMNTDYLNGYDLLTRLAFERMGTDPQARDIHAHSVTGMGIRNHAMAMDAHALLERTDAIVQMCGYAHIFGNKEHYPYEHSLTNVGKLHDQNKGEVRYIKIYGAPLLSEVEKIPSESDTHNTLVVDGVPDYIVRYHHDEETALIRAIKGLPESFNEYSAKTSQENHQMCLEIVAFLKSWADEEAECGFKRVRNRRPAIF